MFPLVVNGFSRTFDPYILDPHVYFFIVNGFGESTLKRIHLHGIIKHDLYMVHLPKTLSPETLSLVRELTKVPGYLSDIRFSNLIYAQTHSNYLRLAMLLENVSSLDPLFHFHKVRAGAGVYGKNAVIELGSFQIERPDDFDYLNGVSRSLANLMRAYILGTVVHEIGHHLWKHEHRDHCRKQFLKIVSEETYSKQRVKFVSDYVLLHAQLYDSGEETVLSEDFSETLRIFFTNPSYLKRHYPQRLEFLSRHFVHLRGGSIADVLQKYD